MVLLLLEGFSTLWRTDEVVDEKVLSLWKRRNRQQKHTRRDRQLPQFNQNSPSLAFNTIAVYGLNHDATAATSSIPKLRPAAVVSALFLDDREVSVKAPVKLQTMPT